MFVYSLWRLITVFSSYWQIYLRRNRENPILVFRRFFFFFYPQWKYLFTKASISSGFPFKSLRKVLSP